ncbi:hypothetical protein UR09_03480 [Candidatus Nitromaritima sp. SCGC AAA799-A02]|nr:hypothetical protein UZ36_04825 [Candidatus Nitromaritima sp. SCGC AAA799-C22]KMP11377.1 hypothetical protein UR09_03480 [Candidatus Nitromaritima sp. SCGC AAA799-A02]
MKICLTVNSSPWSRFKGGGQLAVHHLACALCSRGHEVHAIYSKLPDEPIRPEVPYKIHWARHHNIATVNFNIFSYLSVLRPLAATEKFDVIHGNAEEAYYADAVARETGAACVFTSHAPNIPATGMLGGMLHPLRFMKSVNTYLLREAARSAQRIITFSRFSREIVLTGLGKNYADRVEVISPGIDPSWLEVERNPAPVPHLLFWGRIEEEKGLPELFTAIKKVSAKVPEIKLTLVGEGSRLTEYQQMVSDRGLAGQVELPGWLGLREIQDFATRCSLGVFPSRIESFGLSVVESMAAGLPVIAASSGAIPENVEDRVTGTLVPGGDPGALADAILTALENPEHQETQAGKARDAVRRKFSWDRTADRLVELYKSIR